MIDMGVFLRTVADGARGLWVRAGAGAYAAQLSAGLNHALIAAEGRADMLVSEVAAMATEEGSMVGWFWLTVPLMVLFFCCWAGIPLWHTLTRWDAELKAKHAEIAAAAAVAAPAMAQPGSGYGSRVRGRQPGLCGSSVIRGNQSGWQQTQPPAWHDHDAGCAVADGGPGPG